MPRKGPKTELMQTEGYPLYSDVGHRMLDRLSSVEPQRIGKRLDDRGVIMHDELPRAIGRLETAISDNAAAETTLEALHCSAGNRRESRNSLSQRAWPFLDMMREARKRDADIIWGL